MSSKMLSAMAVALPLAAALPSSTHPHLAIPSFARDSGKIVGGELADEGEFPYIVSLQGPSLCGGSLLDARTIITAAHCFDPETHTPEEFSARAGSNVSSLSLSLHQPGQTMYRKILM
jgi:trypsin